MNSVTRDDYGAFHEASGSAGRDVVLSGRTDRDPATLSPFERKQEFYGLLKTVAAPGIVRVIQSMRERFEGGLVLKDDGAVVTAADEAFVREMAAHRESGDPIRVADAQYRAMRRTIDIAGDVWQDELLQKNDPDLLRMEALTEPQMFTKYGEHPVGKRVASATAQTASVGIGMQELAIRLYTAKYGAPPSSDVLIQAHRSSLRFIMMWADFNRHQLLGLESRIRVLRDDHEGIEPLKGDTGFDIAEDGTLVFTNAQALADVAASKPNVQEGRFGCPGKQHIPKLWDWTEDVSVRHGLVKQAAEGSSSLKQPSVEPSDVETTPTEISA